MKHRSTYDCVNDLRKHGHLVEIDQPIDANLEAAEIQRRVYRNDGPAILFSNVKNCRFSMVSNLFGNIERARFIFRGTLEAVRRAIELKIEPGLFFQQPTRYYRAPLTAMSMRPKSCRNGAIFANQISIGELPQLKSWPDDGGAFITLPQVYTEDVERPGLKNSNLGMYRVQLGGGQYSAGEQIGLHYQIHRGIGVHHHRAIESGQPFRVNIFVGGTPAMTLSAVMPLPEGISELTFAGALAGHRIRMARRSGGLPVYADADFCITGTVDAEQMPEGPFGDHLGYYSLAHDFPVLNVDKVYHRDGAIWPFTVVGRPPQEDTSFGELIHELTGPIIPTVIPGVSAVNAVDAAGVHPLLLAVGSERYTPYNKPPQPQELLTQANAILGQGQMSLAKYLLIVDQSCHPDVHDIASFFQTLLSRIDWRRDLHFQTRTTIDTLDYSGTGFNQGSKLVMAAVGDPIRELPTNTDNLDLPAAFKKPQVCLPGVLAVEMTSGESVESVTSEIEIEHPINRFPLIVIVDDSDFVARNLNNFLWVTFTRSNPALDVFGVDSCTAQKHWGCRGSLVIDAKIKSHHAPPLIESPEVTGRVDALAAAGGPIAKYL